jgi:hypothetical protein
MPVAIKNVGSAIYAGSTVTSITASLPSFVAGDLMLLQVRASGASGTLTTSTPSGWTPIYINNSIGVRVSALFYRVMQAGDTNPSFSFNMNVSASVVGFSFSGVNTSSPIGAIGTVNSGTLNPATCSGITTTELNSLVIYIFNASTGVIGFSTPSGWTSFFDVKDSLPYVEHAVGYKSFVNSGLGSGSISTSDSSSGSVYFILQVEILAPPLVGGFNMPMMGM